MYGLAQLPSGIPSALLGVSHTKVPPLLPNAPHALRAMDVSTLVPHPFGQ